MPSFIAATELLPAAQTVKRYACSFFSFFSCPYKKRTRFSFAKGEKYVLFSLRRKAPKDQSISLKAIYTRLKCSNKFKSRCYAMLPHCRATSLCGN